MFDVHESAVLLSDFNSEDFDLVLQNLDSLLHLGELLTRVGDLLHVLVPLVLDLLVESDQGIKLQLSLLLLLHQVHDEQLFDLEFFLGLTTLGGCLRSCPRHLFTDGPQELDFFDPLVGLILELLLFLLTCFNVRLKCTNLRVGILVLETFLNELTNIDLLLLMQVFLCDTIFFVILFQLGDLLRNTVELLGPPLHIGVDLVRL